MKCKLENEWGERRQGRQVCRFSTGSNDSFLDVTFSMELGQKREWFLLVAGDLIQFHLLLGFHLPSSKLCLDCITMAYSTV